jgi:lambda repressor-like predicted transcriptional regulator
LSSSRRVRKGSRRRPQSAKRQRFMELRERGWSTLAAAREVGVSRTTGNNWSRGYKTYRHGQVVGLVPALERLAVRSISSRFLSQEERIEIADLRHAGLSIRQIAHRLGRAPSTVSSCAATRPGVGVTVRSMRTVARPRVAPAIIAVGLRPTANSGRWSRSLAAATSAARRRHGARRAEGADGRLAVGVAAIDHLGSGNRNGPAPHDRAIARRDGLLLRLPITVAARLK